MQDQETRNRRVAQIRPGQLDLFQLAESLAAENFDNSLVGGFGRVRSELAV